MASSTRVAATVARKQQDAGTNAAPPPTRVGVVGAGYWGPKLIRNFAALPEAHLRLVCDLDAARLQAVGEQYPGVELTTDFRALLDSDVEAVAIATPVSTHYRLVNEALRAGKHVLVEKPLTASTREASELVALADARGLMLMVGHTFLFEPAIQALRDLVRSGALGTIWHVSMRRLALGLFRPDVNVLWDLAPHDISILLNVLGAEPVAVSARGASHVQRGIHDVAYIELRFPHDVMAHVHVSWLDPGKVRRMTVVGSQKMAVYDDTDPEKLRVFDRSVVPADPATEGASRLLYRFGESASVPLPVVEPLRRQCAYFLECVRTGARPRPHALEGMRVVHVLEQADRSLHNNGQRLALDWGAAGDETAAAVPASGPHAAKPLARHVVR